MQTCTYRSLIGLLCLGIMLSPVRAKGNVVLTQDESPIECLEGDEPLLLQWGQHTVDCRIDDVTDSDLFWFDGTNGDQIRLNVSELTSILEPLLEVFDPNGLRIVNTAPGGNLLQELTLDVTGRYLVILSDNGRDETGPYLLQLERVLPFPPAPTMLPGTPIADQLNPITDHDFFTFLASDGDRVRLTMAEMSSNLEVVVEVRDPNGIPIYVMGPGGNLVADLDLSICGTYLVILRDNGLDETGSYTLEMERLYPFQLSPALLPDTPVSEQISPVTDTDLFVFAGDQGSLVRISLAETTSILEPLLQVFGPNGEQLISTAPGGNIVVDLILPTSGVFQIAIADNGRDETGGYVLELQCLLGTCAAPADSDEDGTPDYVDNCPAVENAAQDDMEGDRIGDVCDNCTLRCNHDQRDTDTDGLGNVCDGDFDQNCSVNFFDLGQMKSVFFEEGDLDEDMDGNGSVNFEDLGLLKEGFFLSPGPSGVADNLCSSRVQTEAAQ